MDDHTMEFWNLLTTMHYHKIVPIYPYCFLLIISFFAILPWYPIWRKPAKHLKDHLQQSVLIISMVSQPLIDVADATGCKPFTPGQAMQPWAAFARSFYVAKVFFCAKKRLDEWMDDRSDEWLDEWLDEWPVGAWKSFNLCELCYLMSLKLLMLSSNHPAMGGWKSSFLLAYRSCRYSIPISS